MLSHRTTVHHSETQFPVLEHNADNQRIWYIQKASILQFLIRHEFCWSIQKLFIHYMHALVIQYLLSNWISVKTRLTISWTWSARKICKCLWNLNTGKLWKFHMNSSHWHECLLSLIDWLCSLKTQWDLNTPWHAVSQLQSDEIGWNNKILHLPHKLIFKKSRTLYSKSPMNAFIIK